MAARSPFCLTILGDAPSCSSGRCARRCWSRRGLQDSLEAPAGILDREDPEECARREAMEECGLRLEALEPLVRAWSMPGVSTETMDLFLAPYSAEDRVAPGGGLAEEHEQIEIVEMSCAELAAMMDAGRLADIDAGAGVVAAPASFEPVRLKADRRARTVSADALTFMQGMQREPDMRGKTIVITGGTSGIGAVAAEKLATMGARIVLIARDQKRAEETMGRLRRTSPEVEHAVHFADLLRIADVKRVAAAIAAQEPHIDVLINNAGAMFASRQLTDQGLERTFALNHMAYFVLTAGLRERLIASAPARIVNTASAAHLRAKLDFDDLQLERGFGPMKAYGRSKLCNVLFTRELARRMEGTGVRRTASIPVSSPRGSATIRAA